MSDLTSRALDAVCRARPAAWIAGFTLGAFVLVLASMPLPRVDGHLLGSDGIGYFVYLPSLLLDRDLDFSDEYAELYAFDPRVAEARARRTETGLVANRFAVGPAVLWLPFYLVAHAACLALAGLGLPVVADGMSRAYQAAVMLGGVIYGGVGLWFGYRLGRRVGSRCAALAAVLLVAAAGNLVYYMTVEPSMSHALSVATCGAVFEAWSWYRRRPSAAGAALLGAAAGLAALVRPQDGLLVVPVWLVEAIRAWRADGRRGVGTAGLHAAVAAAAAAAVFSPQLWVWAVLNGSPLSSGYAHLPVELFQAWCPHLVDVLASSHRGLFVWHPVFLAALIGLAAAWRIDRDLAVVGLLSFLLQACLVGSLTDWAQGDAFGGRMFLGLTPLFAAGLAVVLDRAWRTPRGRWLSAAGAAWLVALNLIFVVHYRLDLLGRPVTWSGVTVQRFVFPIRFVERSLDAGR